MSNHPALDREEYIEQAYFFRMLRERIAAKMAAQEVLERIHQEILATTRLPLAIQFLATELKHSGLLSSGFARLAHYFTAFQTFVVRQTEKENLKFSLETALLVLEREAGYRASQVSPAGMFMYQFEAISRNRLGYEEGLTAMAGDLLFDEEWQRFLEVFRLQGGLVDFADAVFLRSELFVQEQQRRDPSYEPPVPPLFGEKEGRIARANQGRDPLYLFAALQRQLGYPEVPRPRPVEDTASKILVLNAQIHQLEMRLRLLESEVHGQIDLTQFLNNPDLLKHGEE